MNSKSLELAKKFLNKKVDFVIDRPMGSKHTKHGFVYELNYGYLPDVLAPDGEELDIYYIGKNMPICSGSGFCLAIIHREDDDDDKLVIVSEDKKKITDKEIINYVSFQEKWFKSKVVR